MPPSFDPKHPKVSDRLVQLVMIYQARGCKVDVHKVRRIGRPGTRPTTYELELNCPKMPEAQAAAFRRLIETYVA